MKDRESSFQDWCSDLETGWLREDRIPSTSATAAPAAKVGVREGTGFERKECVFFFKLRIWEVKRCRKDS